MPWTSLSSKPWMTTLKTISSLSLCRTIVSFIVRGLSAVTAVKMSHTFNIIKTLRFETHFIELRHIMKINNVISLLCAPNWWTKLFGIKIAQGTNNKKELTLLDRGLSLSTSFVLSMSIWAAVATPKTSWDLEIPHRDTDILTSHNHQTKIGTRQPLVWTYFKPESTVGRQQGQQRGEHGSHSQEDKPLRPAPSPLCTYKKIKLVQLNNNILRKFTWSAREHRFPRGWRCEEVWGEGRSRPGCLPRPCSTPWTCGTHDRHSRGRCKDVS